MNRWLQRKIISKVELIILLTLVFILFIINGGITTLRLGIFYGVVSGNSMERTLPDRSKLLFIGSEVKEIKRGDIVSISVYLDGKKSNTIKRVIAMPSETIQIQGNEVYINGNLLEEPYAYYSEVSKDNLIITLKEDEYFVMGDNRMNSQDSRKVGVIPKNFIVGVVVKIKEVRDDFDNN